MSFNIKETSFLRSKKRHSCFVLKEGTKSAELCPFVGSGNDSSLDEWDCDFNLFKTQCNNKQDVVDINEGELNKKYDEKIVNYF
jgi:hypothetical protein